MDKKFTYILSISIIVVIIILLYPRDQKSQKTFQEEIIFKDKLPIQEKEILNISEKESIEIKKEVLNKEIFIPKVPETKRQINNTQDNSIKNIYISDLANPYDLELKEETITLNSSSDKNARYIISLKSSQKITSILPKGKYILLNGTINEDGKKSKFSLSLNEHYKNYTQYSYLEIKNKESNTIANCDGSFLSGITSEYRYNLQCDLYGEMLSCHIEEEEEDIYLKDNPFSKDLKINDKNLSFIKERNLKINQTQGAINGNNKQ